MYKCHLCGYSSYDPFPVMGCPNCFESYEDLNYWRQYALKVEEKLNKITEWAYDKRDYCSHKYCDECIARKEIQETIQKILEKE